MKTATIGDLARPKQWRTLSKSEMIDQGYPVYGANGIIGCATEFTHSQPTLLIGCRGTIGAIHISAPESFVTGNAMALDSLDSTRVDINYLARFLSWRGLSDVTTGTSQPQLTRQNLVKVSIPLPPLPEQRRIATILDHADALLTKRHQVLTHLQQLPMAIFREMFGDPVRNERGWPTRKLADLGTLDRGVSKHRPRNDPALLGGVYPLIQTGDVANSGGYITRWTTTYSDLGLAQSKLWPAGTLCITIAANIAKTGILQFGACFPDSVVGFTSDTATTTYVHVWLSFLQATLESSAPQSAQKNINLGILRTLEVPSPEPQLLREFAQEIGALNSTIAKNHAVQAADDELFTSLQSRAFRGEL